ncbi:MAG: DNA-processing protein DprA [Pseudomonadota bacterium]
MSQRNEDWIDWLRLIQTTGVGLDKARKLLSVFGLPSNIFKADFSALSQVVPERVAMTLTKQVADDVLVQIERTRLWCENPNNHVLTLADDAYPKALLDIADPPILIYAKGRVELLAATSVAVVGSRNATAQGIANAEKFSEALSQSGLTISSGMAAGIDAAAHQGGLRGVGSTVAVIGTGADIVYPARNSGLAHLIADHGCIVSEYPLGMPAIASNFPRRNRIISGLAKGVLVIEAAAKSGSLITARMAAEQGRDVFAIPGSIHSPLSKGCHQLIKQGAKLVDSAQDILEELDINSTSRTTKTQDSDPTSDDESGDWLLVALGYDPVHVDVLVQRTGCDIGSLTGQLLQHELEGKLENLSGGMVRRLK